MEFFGILLFFELIIVSILILRLLHLDKSFGRFALGTIGLVFTLMIFFGYLLDFVLQMKLSSFNFLLVSLPVLVGTIVTSYKINPSLRWSPINYNKKYLSGIILLFAICICMGLFPSFPSMLPIGSGDTQHHYAATSYIYENLELPNLDNFYPLIHHGLCKYIEYKEPLGFHIVVATIAQALGLDPFFVLYPFTIFISALIAITVYEVAWACKNNYIFALISGLIAFNCGILSIAIAGSLYWLFGYFFAQLAIFYLYIFDSENSFLSLLIATIFSWAVVLTYTPAIAVVVPVLLLTLYVNRRFFTLKKISTYLTLYGLTTAVVLLCIGNLSERIFADSSTGWVSKFGGIGSGFSTAVTTGDLAPVLWFGAVVFVILFFSTYFLLKKMDHLCPRTGSFFITTVVFSTFPLMYIVTHPSVLYYPGYNYTMFISLMVVLLGLITLLERLYRFKVILIAISVTLLSALLFFLIWYPTHVDGYGLYYYLKQILFAAAVVPMLLPALLSKFCITISNSDSKLIENASKIRDPLKYSLPNLILLGCVVILMICLINQSYHEIDEIHQINPSITLDEYHAMKWMRENYISIFPSDSYEYYMILDNTRARWFIAITYHQFNMRSIKGDWIHPPWPLSIDLSDFCIRAKVGDIVILDETIDNTTPILFAGISEGSNISYFVDDKEYTLQLIYKEEPLLFVKKIKP